MDDLVQRLFDEAADNRTMLDQRAIKVNRVSIHSPLPLEKVLSVTGQHLENRQVEEGEPP